MEKKLTKEGETIFLVITRNKIDDATGNEVTIQDSKLPITLEELQNESAILAQDIQMLQGLIEDKKKVDDLIAEYESLQGSVEE